MSEQTASERRISLLPLLSLALVLAIGLAGAAAATEAAPACATGATMAPSTDTLSVVLSRAGEPTRDGRARAHVFVYRQLAGGGSDLLVESGAYVEVTFQVGSRLASAHGVTDGEGGVTLVAQFARDVRGYADATAVATRSWLEPSHCPPTEKVSERGHAAQAHITYVSS